MAGASHEGQPRHVQHLEPEPVDGSARMRVQRSRLAFAVSVTLAALPILILDNLSATAETNEAAVEAAEAGLAIRPTLVSAQPVDATTVPSTTAPPPTTATTAAPTTTTAEVEVAAAPPPTAPPTTAAPATTVPPTTSSGADPDDPATWERLAQCESGGNWSLNSGNGYYGGLQFSLGAWQEVGGSGYPHQATKAEQIERGKRLHAKYGWSPWPSCAGALGY